MSTIFIIPVLIAENDIISRRAIGITSIKLFSKDFLLSNVLQFALEIILFHAPIPETRQSLHIDRDGPDSHHRENKTMLFKEAPVAIGPRCGNTMTAKSADRRISSSISTSLQDFGELHSLLGAAKIFRALETSVRGLNAQIAQILNIAGAVKSPVLFKALEGESLAQLIDIDRANFGRTGRLNLNTGNWAERPS